MMGKRGPKPTPTVVLDKRGSRRANRPGEPKPRAVLPEAPPEMTDPARIVWEQMVERLSATPGLLTEVDGNALARYCEMYVRWWKANTLLHQKGEMYPIYQTNKNGELVRDAGGRPVLRYMQQWPQVSIVRTLNASLLKIEQEFGLTPAARAGIQVPASNEPDDDLAAFKVVG